MAPKAAVNLGVLLMEQGYVEGAMAAFRQVIESGHPYYGPVVVHKSMAARSKL